MSQVVLRPPRSNKAALACLGAFVSLICLSMGLSPWIGAATVAVGKAVGLLILLPGAALSALFALSQISLRVVLDETSVARCGLFGTRSLPLDHIDSALFSTSERVDILTLRASYRKLSFTTYAFSRSQLQAIQDHVAVQAQKNARPLLTSRLAGHVKTKSNAASATLFVMVVMLAAAFCALIAFPSLNHRVGGPAPSPARPGP